MVPLIPARGPGSPADTAWLPRSCSSYGMSAASMSHSRTGHGADVPPVPGVPFHGARTLTALSSSGAAADFALCVIATGVPRRNTHAHLGNSPPGVFGAVGTGESLAATGRIRERFLGGRAGPARRYISAYVLSHRV